MLGIETATALGGVALVDEDGRILGEITLLGRESHSERIIPAVAELLATLGASPGDLAAVAVSSGPGSFTGLRTGVASAKGLAFSRGVPLYGVPTLAALAANATAGCGPVCAVLNARRGEVFRALFQAGAEGLARRTPDELLPARECAAGLPPGCLVLGEAPAALREATAPSALRFAPAHLNHPRASAVALSGLAALRAGAPSELLSLLPGYLRTADACCQTTAAGGAKPPRRDRGFPV